MKKITLVIITLCLTSICFSQDTEAPTTPTNFKFSDYSSVAGPQSTVMEWEHSTDNIGVTEYEIYLNGEYLETVPFDGSDVIQDEGFSDLSNGIYCYKIRAKDAAGNSSDFTNEICFSVNCAWCVPDPTDLYISAIMNYSGNNKIIEITNLTENDIDLSSYSLKIGFNGSATWFAIIYTFPDNTTLSVQDTFVIGNSSITMCADRVDDYDNIITFFDGDDVIGLFKNDVLIDIIGELGSSATIMNYNTFAKVEMMVNDGLPNTTYNPMRWFPSSYNTNSCPSELGGYAYLIFLDTEEVETNSFQIYPNPANGDTLNFITKNNQTIDSVTIIDINGRNVFTSTKITNNLLDIQNIKQGIYFVKIQSGDKISTHKLIRQ